jgi:fumarate reductase subunit D
VNLSKIVLDGRQQSEHIKLLQGAFRSKIALLLVLVILTWGLWATLQHGDEKLPDAEAECEKLRQTLLSKWNFPPDIKIGLNSTLSDVMEKLIDPKRPELQKLQIDTAYGAFYGELSTAKDRCQQITDQAYLVKVRIPYLLEPISINGLLLADFWPFVMVAIASAIVIFQLRERTNAIVLSGVTSENSEVPSRELLQVRSNYRVGSLQKARIRRQTFLVYRSPLIVQPESLFVWTLLFLTLYTSFSLEAAHRIEFSHEMTSVLFDYISALWFYCVVIMYLVYRTWDYYERSLQAVFGCPVIGVVRSKLAENRSRIFGKLAKYRIKIGLHRSLLNLARIFDSILALTALAALALTWMEPGTVRGYSFLFGVKNISGGLSTELGYQLWLAVLFVLLCLFLSLTRRRISEKLFQAVAQWTRRIGLVVLFLLGNLFFHLLVLQIIDTTTNFFGLSHFQSHPLLFTNPEAGFYLFSALFVILRWRQSPKR